MKAASIYRLALSTIVVLVNVCPLIAETQCIYWKDNLLQMHCNCSFRGFRYIPVINIQVKFLDLSNNEIQIIQNSSFEILRNLEELDISSNKLNYLDKDAFIGLIALRKLVIGNNYELTYSIRSFATSLFKPLISLEYLDITHNSRTAMDVNFSKNVLSDLVALNSIGIDLIGEHDTTSVIGEGFLSLTKLRTFIAGYCDISFDNKTFINVPYLEVIELEDCSFEIYSLGTLRKKKLRFLSFGGSGLDILIEDNVHKFMIMIEDFGTAYIETLLLTTNFGMLQCLPSDFFLRLNGTGIRHLILNENSLHEVTIRKSYKDPIRYNSILPVTLRHLEIKNNVLQTFKVSMPHLSRLNLERNNLGYFLKYNRYSVTDTLNLTDINLSSNKIDRLHASIFHGHTHLENINVSNNYLTDISFNISHLIWLKTLDMSSNRIEGFDETTMKTLNHLFENSNLQIDLSNNTLHCNCQNVPFLLWIFERNTHFPLRNSMSCEFSNGSTNLRSQFKRTVMQLKKECTSYTALEICLSIAIMGLLITVFGGLVYKYRWRLRYIYYMTRSKYKRNIPDDIDGNYKYDAFISYSDNERNFIFKECIPILEGQKHIKLCIHQRDFLPGEDITQNITNSIHESRKIICIITRGFLDSFYCMFEFNMARMESIYSRGGRNILFLVFFEQFRHQDLSLVMLELIQKDSYIEYPNDEQGNAIFWKKLGEAINKGQ